MVDVKEEREFINPHTSQSQGDRTPVFERLVQYFVFVYTIEQHVQFSADPLRRHTSSLTSEL